MTLVAGRLIIHNAELVDSIKQKLMDLLASVSVCDIANRGSGLSLSVSPQQLLPGVNPTMRRASSVPRQTKHVVFRACVNDENPPASYF